MIDLGSEQGDRGELRRLAKTCNPNAADQLIEFTIERHDFTGLRRLTGRRNETAAAALAELTDE